MFIRLHTQKSIFCDRYISEIRSEGLFGLFTLDGKYRVPAYGFGNSLEEARLDLKNRISKNELRYYNYITHKYEKIERFTLCV